MARLAHQLEGLWGVTACCLGPPGLGLRLRPQAGRTLSGDRGPSRDRGPAQPRPPRGPASVASQCLGSEPGSGRPRISVTLSGQRPRPAPHPAEAQCYHRAIPTGPPLARHARRRPGLRLALGHCAVRAGSKSRVSLRPLSLRRLRRPGPGAGPSPKRRRRGRRSRLSEPRRPGSGPGHWQLENSPGRDSEYQSRDVEAVSS